MFNFCKIMKYIGLMGFVVAIAGCDLSAPTHVGNKSKVPSNLHAVSYSSLPGWRDDDVRYALQAFRNTCKAKIQYTGSVIPDPELLKEKCNMLPSSTADVKTVRAWFESHFQPYQVFNEKGGKTGTYTGYYSPVIDGCRKQSAKCNEPIMGVPIDGRNYKNEYS